MITRQPAVSGLFYPDRREELQSLLSSLERDSVRTMIPGLLTGLIVPHAGLIYSGRTAMAAYTILADHADEYDTLIFLGPSHHIPFSGTITFPRGIWQTPFGHVDVYPHPAFQQAVEPFLPEHSLEVQLPFLWWKQLLSKRIIMLLTSMDDPGHIAARAWIPGSILIVSTDLSHYYPEHIAHEIDAHANTCIPRIDIPCVTGRVEACGKTALLALLHIARQQAWQGHFIDYMTSADAAGSPESVVGYGAYAFTRHA